MEKLKLKLKLKGLEVNETFIYPVKLPPEMVNNLIHELGVGVDISDDWNGSDLDWSKELTLNGDNFNVWGSGFSGSVCFQKMEL